MLIISALGIFSINYYIYLRFIAKSRLKRKIKLTILGLLVVLSFTLLLVRWVVRDLIGSTVFDVFAPSLCFMMVFFLTLFSVSIAADLISLPLVGFKRKKLVNPYYQTVLFLCAAALTVWGQYEGHKIPEVKEVTLKSSLIREPVKIALMSDLHITRVTDIERVKKIVAEINDLHADVIVLAGDILDDEIKHIIKTAQPLKNLRAPLGVYYVTGNHEYYLNVNDAEELIKQIGIPQLENRGVQLREDLYIAGVPDRKQGPKFMHDFDPDAALADASERQFKILVSHQPVENDSASLVLSGHTHGGQMLPFQLISPLYNSGMLSGLYGSKDRYIYISNGAGSWGPQLRVLAPYDISLVTVEPDQNGGS